MLGASEKNPDSVFAEFQIVDRVMKPPQEAGFVAQCCASPESVGLHDICSGQTLPSLARGRLDGESLISCRCSGCDALFDIVFDVSWSRADGLVITANFVANSVVTRACCVRGPHIA